MQSPITGIHHITAMASDPQRNLDFYTGVLGLRFLKKTVNYDDPGTYHFYYGDGLGRPGTILTFFPWPGARRGSRGTGQATVTSFSVPQNSLTFWQERLASFGVVQETPTSRFDEEVLTFYDPDGLKLELVAHFDAERGATWADAAISEEYAIGGFHSVTLAQRDLTATVQLLSDTMGLRRVAEADGRVRFEASSSDPGRWIDLVEEPETGHGHISAGTVHHVAWRAADDAAQEAWRQRLLQHGHRPTEVLDRQYFKSIYFREPGGVLFEMATDAPGFTRDESLAELGTRLTLPSWLEEHRERIERALPTVQLPDATAEVLS